MDKLKEICATKREEVAARKALKPLDECDRVAAKQTPPRGFRKALEAKTQPGFGLIAEVKKASTFLRPSSAIWRKVSVRNGCQLRLPK